MFADFQAVRMVSVMSVLLRTWGTLCCHCVGDRRGSASGIPPMCTLIFQVGLSFFGERGEGHVPYGSVALLGVVVVPGRSLRPHEEGRSSEPPFA